MVLLFWLSLDMIKPRHDPEGLIISIDKNCETNNKQTHTKPQETLELKLTGPKDTRKRTH